MKRESDFSPLCTMQIQYSSAELNSLLRLLKVPLSYDHDAPTVLFSLSKYCSYDPSGTRHPRVLLINFMISNLANVLLALTSPFFFYVTSPLAPCNVTRHL